MVRGNVVEAGHPASSPSPASSASAAGLTHGSGLHRNPKRVKTGEIGGGTLLARSLFCRTCIAYRVLPGWLVGFFCLL